MQVTNDPLCPFGMCEKEPVLSLLSAHDEWREMNGLTLSVSHDLSLFCPTRYHCEMRESDDCSRRRGSLSMEGEEEGVIDEG